MHMQAPEVTPTAYLATILTSQDSERLREQLGLAIESECGISRIEFVADDQEGGILVRSLEPVNAYVAHEAFGFARGFIAGFLLNDVSSR